MTDWNAPNIANAAAPKGPRPPEVWNAWLTLAWGVGAFVVLMICQIVAVIAFIAGGFLPPEQILANPMSLEKDPILLSLAQFIATPFIVGYFVFAARASGVKATEYLALKWPRLRHFLIGLAAVVAAAVAADLLSIAVGHEVTSSFMNDIFFAAKDPATMVMLAVSVVVLAPVQEEIAFRGFFYPGVAKSLGPWPAIVILSAIWAVMHVQYDWFFVGQIFAMGVLIGWLRWWSGSTTLTIILHAAVNAAAIVQAWFFTSAG